MWTEQLTASGSSFIQTINGARFTSAGTAPDVAASTLISREANMQQNPAIAFDGTNYLVVWLDARSDVTDAAVRPVVVAARVSATGAVLDASEKAGATRVNRVRLTIGELTEVVPDALQFAYSRWKHQPLVSLQKFHHSVHTKRRLREHPMLGITSQIFFIAAVVVAVQALIA